MSSLLTTTCATCGTVEVPVERAVLRVEPAGEEAGARTCVMRCPACGRRLERAADGPMAEALVLLGIEVSSWRGRHDDDVLAAPIDAVEIEQFRQHLGHEADPLRWL